MLTTDDFYQVKFLQQVAIFSHLSDDEVREIIERSHSMTIDRNEVLFNEGDAGDSLYVVEAGEIAISIILSTGETKEITSFGSGQFFGEMSLFEDEARSATCFAKEPSRLLVITKDEFFPLIEAYPNIAVKLMHEMVFTTAQRMRATNEFIGETIRWGETARRRAITDQLTGLYNRRYLDEALNEQFILAKKDGTPLSIIMVDMDHFREINDQYSMDKGNELIALVAEVFKKMYREEDIIARYGGDEFTIIMPGLSAEESAAFAEKVRQSVEALDLDKELDVKDIKVTLSQGIASFPKDGDAIQAVRNNADQALYDAKESGRNKVACFS
ncbi:MAG: GGDEF domain-containing protein [bacterium]|nr:GGDEF domain-containing protein [bacterium]